MSSISQELPLVLVYIVFHIGFNPTSQGMNKKLYPSQTSTLEMTDLTEKLGVQSLKGIGLERLVRLR